MADCGCTRTSACMQHFLLALVIIPDLRIRDRGLIDAIQFAVTGLFVPGGLTGNRGGCAPTVDLCS